MFAGLHLHLSNPHLLAHTICTACVLSALNGICVVLPQHRRCRIWRWLTRRHLTVAVVHLRNACALLSHNTLIEIRSCLLGSCLCQRRKQALAPPVRCAGTTGAAALGQALFPLLAAAARWAGRRCERLGAQGLCKRADWVATARPGGAPQARQAYKRQVCDDELEI